MTEYCIYWNLILTWDSRLKGLLRYSAGKSLSDDPFSDFFDPSSLFLKDKIYSQAFNKFVWS